MLKIASFTFSGIPGVRASAQLEDLACEKEELYGLTSACSSTINSAGHLDLGKFYHTE